MPTQVNGLPVDMDEKIVVVEDDLQLNATILETLKHHGYSCLAFSDPKKALVEIENNDIALLITDLKMPDIDGITLARSALSAHPDTRVLVITGFSTLSTVLYALRLGVDSYILKPFRSEELLLNVRLSLERRRLILDNRRYQSDLEKMVDEQIRELRERHQRLSRSQMESIFAISNIIEARDAYTRGHTERVTYFAVTMAERLGWSEERIRELGIGAPLHDIGKIGVPNTILNKKGPFTFTEFEIMKRHPEIGYQMVRGSGFSKSVMACILYHQERFDGGGYPYGLAGYDIPEEGRLMAACDAFDAMTSDRIYRPAMPVEKAIRIMREESGSHFDPEIAAVFCGLFEKGVFDAVLGGRDVKMEFEKLVSRLTAA
jgi:response regulator RpfG family c-di-GMP phosphodiesterase